MKSSGCVGTLVIPLLIFLLTSCSTPSYTPEIWGVGAKHGRDDGIVYRIPPKDPDLKMKVVSAGIQSDRLLRLRLYFFRMTDEAPKQAQYLDPKELSVKYGPKEPEVFPVKIKGSPEHKPLIELTTKKKQEIELAFPILPSTDPKVGVESFVFYWKIHFGTQLSEAQAAVFDRNGKKESAPGPDDFPSVDEDPYSEEDGMLWW